MLRRSSSDGEGVWVGVGGVRDRPPARRANGAAEPRDCSPNPGEGGPKPTPGKGSPPRGGAACGRRATLSLLQRSDNAPPQLHVPHPLLDTALHPVVGHRGNCAHAPENTVESFRQALALGVAALEFDVRITRDGHVVVIHDATVGRTTGATGAVAAMTLAELRTLDAGATFTRDGGRSFPYRERGITISTLAEVLEATDDVPLLIEIKTVAAAAATRRAIEAAGSEARCIVASFDPAALVPFRGVSRIATGATPADVAPLVLPALLGRRFASLPFSSMSLPRVHRGIPVPLAALARACRPAGVPLHVWTINDPAVALRLWERGINGILSDDPAAILAVRAGAVGGGDG